MRRSKRMRSPGGWIAEYSWEERVEVHKRLKRSSRSGERERQPGRTHHHKTYERCHISSKRLECREHRAREASLEHGGYKGRVDPVRETEREKDENHCSQSSAHRGCSSRECQRSRHHSSRSNSVNDLSIC